MAGQPTPPQRTPRNKALLRAYLPLVSHPAISGRHVALGGGSPVDDRHEESLWEMCTWCSISSESWPKSNQ